MKRPSWLSLSPFLSVCLRPKWKGNTHDILLTWVVWLRSFYSGLTYFYFFVLSVHIAQAFQILALVLDHVLPRVTWNKCETGLSAHRRVWRGNRLVRRSGVGCHSNSPALLQHSHWRGQQCCALPIFVLSIWNTLDAPASSLWSTSIPWEANFTQIAESILVFFLMPFTNSSVY